MSPHESAIAVWAVWVVSWVIAAAWSARTEARPALGAELPYRALTFVGVALLFGPGRFGWRTPWLWQTPLLVQWALVGVVAGGFAFCWWARLHLGAMWSGWVTRKEGHRIVDTGPYRLVRHPIYTGIIIAAAATAAQAPSTWSIAGLAFVTVGCWIKARLEERFLRAELGAEKYDAYARRTGMLAPFV
jgi:protein-S-isoprenylcysteine O-methyltransferase Ste14